MIVRGAPAIGLPSHGINGFGHDLRFHGSSRNDTFSS
jgi:hypothetical protein